MAHIHVTEFPTFVILTITNVYRRNFMETSRVTSKGQTTIPASIRKAANITSGDLLMFTTDGNQVTIMKVELPTDDYSDSISETFSEWLSPEDEEAWCDL